VNNKQNQHWKTVHYNNLGSTAFKEDQWIGYDDKYDIAVKVCDDMDLRARKEAGH